MPRKLKIFPTTRRIRMDWAQFADGQIYLFTPDDHLYADAKRFHTAARVWAKRHGYTFDGRFVPPDVEGAEPGVAIRFEKEGQHD